MSNTTNRELLRHYYEQGLAMGMTEGEAEEYVVMDSEGYFVHKKDLVSPSGVGVG